MTLPEFTPEETAPFEVPRISFENPDYIKQEYIASLTELENMFGELRNADEAARLAIIDELLARSDGWLDERFERIGISQEVRTRAAQIELEIYRRAADLFGLDIFNPGLD